ncbi:MAG: sugar ABC transporter ATP-binding protein [Caldilineaceae bacterium]
MSIAKEPATKPVLEMRNVSKAFPGVQALQDVNLSVAPGEIHGLLGKNGAGKSTLMAILMGIQPADTGTVTLDGYTFTEMTPREALDAGVAYVPQRINMMSALTVAENVLAGMMPVNRLGFVNWRQVFAEAEDRLTKLGLPLDVRARVEGLSVAEQTMLAIAKALFSKAKLIILDEPTAALPRADIDRLFGFVRSLKKSGVAFIYISHHLEEVFELCDRATVLRNGQLVATRAVEDLDTAALIRLMVGEDVKEFTRGQVSSLGGEPVLTIKKLARRGYYEDISLTLHKGEVIGLAGLEGSGAAALAAGLFGLQRLGTGDVLVNNQPFHAQTPQAALHQGVAYLPQDRYLYGIVGTRPLRENVTYPILERLSRWLGFVDQARERAMVEDYVQQLGIVTPSQEQRVSLLSGGNQQKVVFAKLAATKPHVLILHEPTQGVDVHAKVDIYRIVSELSAQGVGILIISSEVRELLGVCDSIKVMYKGHIVRTFATHAPDATPENILLAIEGETVT